LRQSGVADRDAGDIADRVQGAGRQPAYMRKSQRKH